jgi:arylformamidase
VINYPKPRTPAEFDAGYANSITPDVVERWERYFREASTRVMGARPKHIELAYGVHERHKIDFFPSSVAAPGAPTLVAIHGGLWFLFDRWMMHFLVPAFTAAGVHVACPAYRLAPEYGLDDIVDDCRQSVRYLSRNAARLGITPGRFSVLGHSAAGQLAAVTADTDWQRLDNNLPARVVQNWIGVSGFYDIEPFARTGFQEMVEFSDDAYRRWNPARRVHRGQPGTLLITGARESDLLHDMMTGYAALLDAVGVPVTTLDVAEECHFSVLAKLGDSTSKIHRRVLEWVTD